MTKLLLDADLSQKLVGAGGEVELCDESGRTVGFFVPVVQSLDEKVYSDARQAFTREQLDIALQEPGGRSLEEIIRDLPRP